MELNLAVEASRSSLVGALLRTAVPDTRQSVVEFLSGLSRDELECLAEFQGACLLEAQIVRNVKPYRLMADFFDPAVSDRWLNADDRAHKTFLVLEWLEHTRGPVPARISSVSSSFHAA